jgi:hypothetical protein
MTNLPPEVILDTTDIYYEYRLGIFEILTIMEG